MTLAIACPSLALRQPGNCERAPPIPALAPPPPCPCLPHLVLVYFVVCSTVAKFRLLLLDPHPSYAARRCLVFIPRGNWQIVCNYGFLGIPNTKPFHHVRSRNTSNYKPTTYLPPGTPSRPGYVKPLPTVSRQHCHDSARYIHTNISRSSLQQALSCAEMRPRRPPQAATARCKHRQGSARFTAGKRAHQRGIMASRLHTAVELEERASHAAWAPNKSHAAFYALSR